MYMGNWQSTVELKQMDLMWAGPFISYKALVRPDLPPSSSSRTLNSPFWSPFAIAKGQDVWQKVQDLRGRDQRAHFQASDSSSGQLPSSSSRLKQTTLLKETCNYIKSLHKEVSELSGQLSELMAATDFNGAQAEVLQSIFRS
ncbi:hypothetical protein ZIOFF_074122 [Zingiber officinale]|uniref:BHLH domain-containing protein n=1 Tax=Zingiber officinale TaxID=94328 RepID=A0A8J5C854_ZINOF|nr:hypothetical protein ZIOFF_074122 [Zingiber officinale]